MIKENRISKLRKRINSRLYFNREISIGETKVVKCCEVTTIVTNHFPKNLKKRYRFSLSLFLKVEATSILAIGFLSGQNCRKKLWQMEAPTVKFTAAHVDKHAFCDVHKYFIMLLDGRVLFVSYLPFKDYESSMRRFHPVLKRLFSVKLMKRWVILGGLKFWNSIRSRTVSLENYRVHEGVFTSAVEKLAFICVADVGQFWAQLIWSKRKVFVRFDNFS